MRTTMLSAAVAVSCALGITIGYFAVSPAVLAARAVEATYADFSMPSQPAFTRLRGTIISIAEDQSTVTVEIPDLYHREQTDMLTVTLDNPSTLSDIAMGETVFIEVIRSEGPLRARTMFTPALL